MKQSGFGITALVIGILAVLLSCTKFGAIVAIAGVVFGVIGLVQRNKKKGLAIAGTVCSAVAIVLFILTTLVSYMNDNREEFKKTGEADVAVQSDSDSEEAKMYNVGDVVESHDLRITFISAGNYKSDDGFSKPKKGNEYYRMEFEFENIGDSDETISSMIDWTCYADSYKMEQSFVGDDDIDGTISTGKKIKGAVYFEVPKDASEITLEYTTNVFTGGKVVFKVK